MRRNLSLLLVFVLIIGIFTSVPASADSVDMMIFELNRDSKSYRVASSDRNIEGEIVIPETYNGMPVTVIAYGAFSNCTKITSVIIPDSVTDIEDRAFYYCYNLESITIPDTDMNIGADAFTKTIPYYNYFNSDEGVFYIGNHLIEVDENYSWEEFVIKDGTKTIASSAFDHCTNLYAVTIPDSVINIGIGAFSSCINLTSVTIPANIGDYAFDFCSNLTSVTIKDGVTSIGAGAFNDCTNLTSFNIPRSVSSIGARAFSNCSNFTSINIPDSVTNIGEDAFYNTAYYNDDKNWEQGVLYIGNHLVAANKSFNNEGVMEYVGNIEGSYAIKDGTLTIADYAFGYCEKLTDITIPHSVKYIGIGAFFKCTAIKSIIVPDSVIHIGGNVFNGCELLSEIKLPDSISEISEAAFAECKSLAEIKIPDSVTSIGEVAFYNCSSLKSIVIPDGVTCLYYATFSGCELLSEIKLPDSIVEINNSVFSNCKSLTEFKLPDSVTSIGMYAFSGCSSLKSFVIPDGVTCISYSSFRDCENLEDITIPDSVTSIGIFAFENCLKLKSIKIPESVVSISDLALGYYGVESIEDYMKMEDFTIYGIKGSAAEAYATENGFNFKILCYHTSTEWVTDKKATVNETGLQHKVCTECGETLETGVKIPQLKCSKPTLVSAQNKSGSVLVTWKKVTGADSYEIYRKVKGGSWAKIGTAKSNATTYTDSKAKSGTTYYYTVRAKNEAGLSSYNTSGVSIKCLATPALKTVSNTSTGVKITWGKVTGTEVYKVYRKTSKSGSWQYIGKTSSTSYTDKTAKKGTSYYYTVQAYSGSVKSSYNADGLSIRRLSAPKISSAVSQKSGVLVKWNKIAGAQGYVVYRQTGNGSYTKLATVKGISKISYVDKSAKKGKKYTYKVKAYYGSSYSAYSNTKSVTDKY